MGVNKYHNIRTEVDGISFASRKEARRYSELKLLEKAGKISDLKLQPRFSLKIGANLICTYVGDFLYLNADTKLWTLEDAKGVETPLFKIKRKLMWELHEIEIVVI